MTMNAELHKTMEAITYHDVALHTNKNIACKIYINQVMPKVKYVANKPKAKKCKTKGKSILKSEKKPKLSGNTLSEQNYLTAVKFTNTNGMELKKTVEQLTSYIKANITKTIKGETVHTVGKKSFDYILKKGSKIKATCLNGKISDIQYDINNDSNIKYTVK